MKLYDPDEEVHNLPKDIFKENVNLTNVSSFFREMKLNYTLTSNSFENNKIVYFDGIFSDTTGYGKQGMIPYRLFYQKNNVIKSMNDALRNSNSTDITSYNCSSVFETNFTSETSDGLVTFNDLIYDGTEAAFLDREIEFLNRTTDLSGNPLTVRKVFEDIIDLYEDYIDKGLEPTEYYILMGYYDHEHEKPTVDRLPELYVRTYKEPITYVLTTEVFNEDSELNNAAKGLNYFCPPDIFAYCKDTNEVTITGIFSSQEDKYSKDGHLIGFRGRIPEMLFRPLTQIKSLENVFTGVMLTFPHTYGTKTVDGSQITYTTGYRFYPKLFYYCKNVTNVNALFQYNIIWGLTIIPENLFNSNEELSQSIETMVQTFSNVNFYYVDGIIGNPQLPVHLCSALNNLTNVQGMFYRAKKMTIVQDFFTKMGNPNIMRVSSFMNDANLAASSSVPEFWNWGTISEYSECYARLDANLITNYSNIPEWYRRSY